MMTLKVKRHGSVEGGNVRYSEETYSGSDKSKESVRRYKAVVMTVVIVIEEAV